MQAQWLQVLAEIKAPPLTNKAILLTGFPWKSLGDGATVCDVGGGIGSITMQLAKAHPNLLLKLQDSPERIDQAQNEVWPVECPEAIRERRIEFKAMDFLTESPIKQCDIYYVRFGTDIDARRLTDRSNALVEKCSVRGSYTLESL